MSSILGQTPKAQAARDTQTARWAVVLDILYGGLFVALVVAINPWGDGRGAIWTRPKVFMMLFLALTSWGYLLYRWLLPAELAGAKAAAGTERQRMFRWQTSLALVLTLIGWAYLLVSRFIPGSFAPEIIGDKKLFMAALLTAFAWGIVLFKWLTGAREMTEWTPPQREASFVAIFTTLVWGTLLVGSYLPGPLTFEPTRNQFFVAGMFTALAWGVVLLRWLMAGAASAGAPSLKAVTSSRMWRWSLGLWLGYLALGLVSVYLSPSPTSALRAQVEMGDGWYYWAIVGAFTLGNVLLISLHPRLFKVQLYGVVLGSLVLTLSLLPQVYDWTMDYTVNAGETIYSNKLRSTIYATHMPIGLYSHRGHAAVVLAFGGVLALLSYFRGWLRPMLALPLFSVLAFGVYLASTRGATLAFAVGLLYLIVRFPLARLWRKLSGRAKVLLATAIPLLLVGAFLFALTGGGARKMPNLSGNWDDITSGRTYLWRTGYAGIEERPLFGWGFNGFGLSWPFVADWNDPFKYGLIDRLDDNVHVKEVLKNSNYDFVYIGVDGERHVGRTYTNKAHNLFIDTILSIGLVGFTAYLLLIGLFIYLTSSGVGKGLEVVALVHLLYCLTWFDTAQFSHLVWWSLSAGLALVIAQRLRAEAGHLENAQPS